MTNKADKPTIVLVHGAFAESSSWNGVLRLLIADGYPVVAAANPLRSAARDAAYLGKVIDGIAGPVVLVGHSYGGTVITNAVAGRGNVKALIYVAAFAPDAGETSFELAGRFPGATLGEALAPPVPLSDGEVDLYILQDKFRDQFAADVPADDANLMAATQRPIVASAGNEPSGKPAWKQIPSWFVYGDRDLNIPTAAHAFMAKRAGSRETIEIPGGSHVVMISQPKIVADLIVRAAQASSVQVAA